MAEKKNELAVIKGFELPLLSEGMNEIVAEEMDGLTITFDRVKIPSGGGVVFEIPGDNPDEPETVKELVGIIIDKHPVNAYWEEAYSGQNSPPACSALDGKWGTGSPGGECRLCPLNQWGSATNEKGEQSNGKACKNMQRVYILREGDVYPLLLTLPPTSIKNLASYVARKVISEGLRTYEVITKVTLKKAVSSGGITYSQAFFQLAGKLSKEQTSQMKEFSNYMKGITRYIEVYHDEFKANDDNISALLDDDDIDEVFAEVKEKA